MNPETYKCKEQTRKLADWLVSIRDGKSTSIYAILDHAEATLRQMTRDQVKEIEAAVLHITTNGEGGKDNE